jgi:hypothetical protein
MTEQNIPPLALRCRVYGRDYAGRLMRCAREAGHAGKHTSVLGGRIRREFEVPDR